MKKLYKANAIGKLPDRHFERLLSEYDCVQTTLEAIIAETRARMDSLSEEKLKTDSFIELVKRYTGFSKLTTPMINEFIERAVIHEGEGRGADRHQRVDVQ